MSVLLGAAALFDGRTGPQSFGDLMNGGGGAETGPGTGQLALRRTYNSGAPPTGGYSALPCANDHTTHGTSASWWSCKGDRATWLANGYLARIEAILAGVPNGHTFLWSVNHEPENDTPTWDPDDWREIQKIAHKITANNRAGRPIYYVTGPLITDTPDGGHGGLNNWGPPVYQSGDSRPAGYSVGDLAFDAWGFDLYDRYPDNTLASGRREWDPVAGGNTKGMTGYLDLVVAYCNNHGASITRSDLSWALGEIGTERRGTAQRDWWADLVTNAADDDTTCLAFAHFSVDAVGEWAPFPVDQPMQQWIRDNTVEGVYNPGPPEPNLVGRTLSLVYDIEGAQTIGRTLTLVYDIEGAAEPETGIFVGWGIPV